ncbi:MAG: hypothetical protein ACYDH6_08395 [Acidimicrobiales bacterium]
MARPGRITTGLLLLAVAALGACGAGSPHLPQLARFGTSVHLATSAACPTDPPPGVINDGSGLRDLLVPTRRGGASINGVHICAWARRSASLVQSTDRRVGTDGARALAGALNALPPGLVGAVVCPSDNGAVALAVFITAESRRSMS